MWMDALLLLVVLVPLVSWRRVRGRRVQGAFEESIQTSSRSEKLSS